MLTLVIGVQFVRTLHFRRVFPPPPAVEQRIREAEHREDSERRRQTVMGKDGSI